jgi:hypothetical protein
MTEFTLFWETYPGDLCNRKGSRQESEKKWDKIDSSTQAQIIVNMRELMRVDRKVKKTGAGRAEWVWPMATTWLNQARWEDIQDIKQTADMPIDKRLCDCGNAVGHKNQCWECHDKDKPDKWGLKDEFIKNGLLHTESKQERAERCKDFLRQRGYLGTVIPERT